MNRSFIAIAMLTLLGMKVTVASSAEVIDVYKSLKCGCCSKWIDHIKDAGFEVRTHNVMNVPLARRALGMPERFGSCHTAKIGNYVVEGHVPAADIQRLINEKPKAVGIAVPSMPPGSPGMESTKPVPYNTLLVQAGGEATVFAKH